MKKQTAKKASTYEENKQLRKFQHMQKQTTKKVST